MHGISEKHQERKERKLNRIDLGKTQTKEQLTKHVQCQNFILPVEPCMNKPFLILLPALLQIHMNPKQKEFLASSMGFLKGMAISTNEPIAEKLSKCHCLTHACNLDFLGQMTPFELL